MYRGDYNSRPSAVFRALYVSVRPFRTFTGRHGRTRSNSTYPHACANQTRPSAPRPSFSAAATHVRGVSLWVSPMAKRSGLSATTAPSKKGKRQVTIATFQKWQTQFEREHATLSWLRCDRDSRDKSLVDCLWCDVCRKHEDRIVGMKNFSRAWITGSSNHKNSNIVDHATSEQHRAAMAILLAHKQQGLLKFL